MSPAVPDRNSSPRLLVYALGGGFGHLTRSYALARKLAPEWRVRILCHARAAAMFPALDGVELVPLESKDSRVLDDVRREISCAEFDALLVDTFPRGICGEIADLLPGLAVPRCFVHRDLNPHYVARYELRRFIDVFDCIFVPGEAAPFEDHPRAFRTSRWLARDAGELFSRTEARRHLAVDDDRPLAVVIACGTPDECREMADLASEITEDSKVAVRLASRESEISSRAKLVSYWPLIECLPGVDLLLGQGGYNTVSEARAAGVPLLAIPRERTYDRQARRLRQEEIAIDRASLVRAFRALDWDAMRGARRDPVYENGANEAVRVLRGVVAGQ
ncbi:MAG: hypothetical protein AAF517_08915 [Planctomycetota bacterium]